MDEISCVLEDYPEYNLFGRNLMCPRRQEQVVKSIQRNVQVFCIQIPFTGNVVVEPQAFPILHQCRHTVEDKCKV